MLSIIPFHPYRDFKKNEPEVPSLYEAGETHRKKRSTSTLPNLNPFQKKRNNTAEKIKTKTVGKIKKPGSEKTLIGSSPKIFLSLPSFPQSTLEETNRTTGKIAGMDFFSEEKEEPSVSPTSSPEPSPSNLGLLSQTFLSLSEQKPDENQENIEKDKTEEFKTLDLASESTLSPIKSDAPAPATPAPHNPKLGLWAKKAIEHCQLLAKTDKCKRSQLLLSAITKKNEIVASFKEMLETAEHTRDVERNPIVALALLTSMRKSYWIRGFLLLQRDLSNQLEAAELETKKALITGLSERFVHTLNKMTLEELNQYVTSSGKPDKMRSNCPNLYHLEKIGNSLSIKIMNTLLLLNDVRQRTAFVKRLIYAAHTALIENKDFLTPFYIMTSLGRTPIEEGRLKATWGALSVETYATYETLKKVLLSNPTIESMETYHIPTLAPFLKKLCYSIEQMNDAQSSFERLQNTKTEESNQLQGFRQLEPHALLEKITELQDSINERKLDIEWIKVEQELRKKDGLWNDLDMLMTAKTQLEKVQYPLELAMLAQKDAQISFERRRNTKPEESNQLQGFHQLQPHALLEKITELHDSINERKSDIEWIKVEQELREKDGLWNDLDMLATAKNHLEKAQHTLELAMLAQKDQESINQYLSRNDKAIQLHRENVEIFKKGIQALKNKILNICKKTTLPLASKSIKEAEESLSHFTLSYMEPFENDAYEKSINSIEPRTKAQSMPVK